MGLLDKAFETPADQAMFALGSGLLGVRKGDEGRALMNAMAAYNQAQQERRRNELVELQKRTTEMQLSQEQRRAQMAEREDAFYSKPENFMSRGQSAFPPNEMDPEGSPAAPPSLLPPQMIGQRMIEGGLARQGIPLMSKGGEPFTLSEGAVRYGPDGRPIASNPKTPSQSLPSAIQEYQFAVQQGYKGTFEQWDTSRKRAGASSTNVFTGPSGRQPSPMERKFDEKGADDLSAWALGGFADVNRQIATLRGVSQQLTDESGLTGPTIGVQPRPALAVTNPKALQALEQVEEVIQRNLRMILGAQFTEKEGERLISRAYNPYLKPSQNKVRIDALLKQMEASAQAKQEAYTYYQRHGTLQGWQGKMPSIEDFYAAIENAGAVGGQVNGGWKIEKVN